MVTKRRKATRQGKEPNRERSKRFALPCCFGLSVSRTYSAFLSPSAIKPRCDDDPWPCSQELLGCCSMSSSFPRVALALLLALAILPGKKPGEPANLVHGCTSSDNLQATFSGGAQSARVFTVINHCKTTIWPAASPGDSFGGGGFALRTGQSMVFKAPEGWSGRIWGRTECNFDASGNGSCATGGCGTSLKCGASGAPPASLAEFTLTATDYYDVSLVDGFNLPVVVRPVNGQGNCSAVGCDGDLRDNCPSELAVKVNGRTVACRSACDVFDTDQYCCRGQFGNPATCQPTFYSKKFKGACPTAYSYAYDDPTSIFTCSNADYIITFCSNRKQSACSYHNNRLVCSGSGRSSWPITSAWMVLALLFSFWSLKFSP